MHTNFAIFEAHFAMSSSFFQLSNMFERWVYLSRETDVFFQTEATGKSLGFQAELEDVDTLGSDTVARTLLTHATASSLREVAMHFFLGMK